MDTRTGDIVEAQKICDEFREHYVDIEEPDMTKKQRQAKSVSLQDHTSKLGKKLTTERQNRGLTKNKYRKLRRQGKLK